MAQIKKKIRYDTGARKKEMKEHYDYAAFKELQYDRLADGLRAHMDMEYVYSILREAKISCDWER